MYKERMEEKKQKIEDEKKGRMEAEEEQMDSFNETDNDIDILRRAFCCFAELVGYSHVHFI